MALDAASEGAVTYSHREAALALGMTARAVGKWLHRRLEVGPIPGYVGGEITDETIDYIREQRAARLDRNGRVMPRAHQAFTQDPHERQIGLKDRVHVHEYQPRTEPMVETFTPPPHADPIVQGLTPASRKPDERELWERACSHQRRDEAKTSLRNDQRIIIQDERPVAVAILSDPHLDNAHADVIGARRDADLIAATDGMYAVLLNDLIDNFIAPKLAFLQREQPFPFRDSLALAESWLHIMGKKILAAVAGNHDNWSYRQAGLDLLATLLGSIPTLYDQHEIRFALHLGDARWRFKLRHQWSHKSQYNASHPMEWDHRFNDGQWDFAFGGHTHGPSLFRDFYDNNERKRKCAIQIGSYELDSAFGREMNMARPVPGGSAALMLYPDGTWERYYSLDHAARVLQMERARP